MLKQERLVNVKKVADDNGIDCIILVPGVNLFYLSGLQMEPSERITLIVVPVDAEPAAVVPLLEAERVASATGIKNIFSYEDEQGPVSSIQAALSRRRKYVYGVEFRYMRLLESKILEQSIGAVELRDSGPLFARLRARKDKDELAIMEKAAHIADEAVAAGISAVRPDVSERSIADIIGDIIKRHRAEAGIAVASGVRSSVPHAHTSDKIIERGDAVWIDIVVYYESYVADITRSCFGGKPDPEFVKIYEIVLEAQKRGRTIAKPGMTGEQVDALCRDYIIEAGYGDHFIHRTGHGIGLEVHEEPYIVKGNHNKLEPGMTFTVEPGIYIAQKGGIRIEDDVVLTVNGVRSLTSARRDLVH